MFSGPLAALFNGKGLWKGRASSRIGSLTHRAAPPRSVRHTLGMVWNHKCNHWIGRAYKIRQSLCRSARLHIDFPARLFHRTGLNPIQSETAPVSCDMLQPGTPFRPRKAIEWAPHANLPLRVVEFFIEDSAIEAEDFLCCRNGPTGYCGFPRTSRQSHGTRGSASTPLGQPQPPIVHWCPESTCGIYCILVPSRTRGKLLGVM
jgi:hypothetical protein